MSDYKKYPVGTRVMIKSTGEHGEAFESIFGYISVCADGEERYRIFDKSGIIFLDQ